jgi:hypothetical protein
MARHICKSCASQNSNTGLDIRQKAAVVQLRTVVEMVSQL